MIYDIIRFYKAAEELLKIETTISLGDYLGGQSLAGGKLKETGTTHWSSPNEGATNEVGFTALPGGLRNDIGIFWYIGDNGYFWTSTERSSTEAYHLRLYYNLPNLAYLYYYKNYGKSVRCVKD